MDFSTLPVMERGAGQGPGNKRGVCRKEEKGRIKMRSN